MGSYNTHVGKGALAGSGGVFAGAAASGPGIRLLKMLGVPAIALADAGAICLSMAAAYFAAANIVPAFNLGIGPVRPDQVYALWWFPLLCVLVMAYEGSYRNRLPFWQGLKYIIKDITVAVVLSVLYVFFSKSYDVASRSLFILTYIMSILLVPLARYGVQRQLFRKGIWQRPVLILGAGKTAELLIRGFRRESFMGYRPVGLLEDDPGKLRGIIAGTRRVPVLGGFDDVEAVMKETGVRDVIIAAPGMENRHLVKLTNRLQQISANVMLVPDLFGIPLTGIRVDHLFDEKAVILSMQNNLASPGNRILKRCFDIVVGTLILIPLIPILLLIAAAIRLDSPGGAIFSGKRIGRDGKEFPCYKFRTMHLNNDKILKEYLQNNPEAREEWERFNKLRGHDPRVTRVGRFLRKFSLDELPQIINVINGEMSLVGPRPYLPRERKDMEAYADIILKTPPGITGLWQVSGRSEIDFNGRLHMESWYVRNWSLWQDITLLIRTIGVVVRSEGAY
ncbi:MAG: undecaprenyl-phosphate galactose phosphotransferase WbaP [Bacillota bacterium]